MGNTNHMYMKLGSFSLEGLYFGSNKFFFFDFQGVIRAKMRRKNVLNFFFSPKPQIKNFNMHKNQHNSHIILHKCLLESFGKFQDDCSCISEDKLPYFLE